MDKRIYNIVFHTHTVSSIIISVALYVIFFAGSFSFFRDEAVNWERGHTVEKSDEIHENIDILLQNLSKKYQLYGRDITLSHYYNERRVSVSLGRSKDSTASKEAKVRAFFYLDTQDKSTASYTESYTLGEFLYRLHFFAQIPYPVGYYLSGFVAFFFLFAILTGIIIHWQKIVSNFYVFRPWAKLKTIWTDSHTALGLIGFPFQLVYALTGAYFMLSGLLMIPFASVLYGGDQQKLNKDLGIERPVYQLNYERLPNKPSLSNYMSKTRKQWKDFKVNRIQIHNYGDANMHLSIIGSLSYRQQMNGMGKITYKVTDGSVVYQKNPLKGSSYPDGVKNILYHLHYADYAGLGLRVISFVLGLVSCFVILSGVMIWLVARNKKSIPEKRRRFNQKVVKYYLAICLSMYPMVALEFILVKAFSPAGKSFIYQTFFIGWLLLSVFFILKKDNTFIIKLVLRLGGIFGLFIPIANGVMSGNWLWVSWQNQLHQMLFIEVFWLTLAGLSFISASKIRILSRNLPRQTRKIKP